ncbi:hypothetical protein [Sphaerisporangium krabiense]|uniref:Anticodon-binding domain-containing protein n=1 Tax=Sphaerisporangium krabiense TaxID=763782 RepID=A0A7W8ZCP7_9ACTN|nr:hypothetical protein [Sphaerisporangium krabiense]MBB5631579.1 hypothetical protein [Sphaerisporangium krabiense]
MEPSQNRVFGLAVPRRPGRRARGARFSYAEREAGGRLLERCLGQGLRARVCGPERGGLAARVRRERLAPYQAVIGSREAAAEEVALRLRDGRRLPAHAGRCSPASAGSSAPVP